MTNLPGHRFRLRWFTALSLAILTSVAWAQVMDVFPLAKGMRYTYQHESSVGSWTEWWGNGSRDSGLVSYQVMDSARVNDTAIAWTIRQSRDVTVWARHAGIGGGSDTTYQRADSTLVTLTEFTTGWHELRCESYVWQFPQFSRSPACPVFRYSDTSSARVFYTFPSCRNIMLIGNYDSLWLSQDSGLTRREYSICSENGDDGWRDWRSSGLLTRILLSAVESPQPPQQFVLFQNYPNPFNPSTTIQFTIPVGTYGRTSLRAFDLLGREVATLVDEVKQPGTYTVRWDASGTASGIYFYRLAAGPFTETRKLILLQ